MGKKLGLGFIEALPIEVKLKIVECLSGTDAAKLACVSHEWRRLIPSPNDSFWKKMCFADQVWAEMWKLWWIEKDVTEKVLGDVELIEKLLDGEIGEEWWNNMCLELWKSRDNSDWVEIPEGWNWKKLFGLWVKVRGDISQYLYFLSYRPTLDRFSALINIIRANK